MLPTHVIYQQEQNSAFKGKRCCPLPCSSLLVLINRHYPGEVSVPPKVSRNSTALVKRELY
jgi:hypothetical protein